MRSENDPMLKIKSNIILIQKEPRHVQFIIFLNYTMDIFVIVTI